MYDKNKSIMYNASGCYDPTAGAALKSVAGKMRSNSFRGKNLPVFICASRPIKSETDLQYLRHLSIFAANQDARPIVPALFYADILDSSERQDRSKLLAWTRSCLRSAAEIWVFDGEPPESLHTETQRFLQSGKIIRYFESQPSQGFRQTKCVRKQRAASPKEHNQTDTKG